MADSVQVSRVFGESIASYSGVGGVQQTFIKAQVVATFTDVVPTARGVRVFGEVTASFTDVPTAKRGVRLFVEVIAPAGQRNRRTTSIFMG